MRPSNAQLLMGDTMNLEGGSRQTGLMKAIAKLVAERGEVSITQIAKHLGRSLKSISGACAKLSNPVRRDQQLIHIVRHESNEEGLRKYPRSVYASGPGENAKRNCKPRHVVKPDNIVVGTKTAEKSSDHDYLPIQVKGVRYKSIREFAQVMGILKG